MVDGSPRSSDAGQEKRTYGSDWDQVMLAMDVVDTLRHREAALNEVLARDDDALIEKVRCIYRDQGIDVPDDTIVEAVKALKEQRFSYKQPKRSWRLLLAHAYIDRVKCGRRVAVVAFIGVSVWGVFYLRESHNKQKMQAQIEAQKAEEKNFAELIADSGNLIERAQDLAKTPDAKSAVDSATNALTFAIDQGNSTAAKRAVNDLRNLMNEIGVAYDLRIVSRPDKKSGVFRIPKDNPGARNYYVIVEAIDHHGNLVEVSITSEENSNSRRVSTWGIRVDSSVYKRVKQDKLDDGIIQNIQFGSKRAGALKPDYQFPTKDGALTQW